MRTADLQKLGLWLAAKKNQPWERGKNDCCTLFMEYHDHMHGTDTLSSIYGKYNNLRSAIKISRQFDITGQWLPNHGYNRVDSPENGDIVILEQQHYPSGFIVCMGQAWSNVDGRNIMQRFSLDAPDLPYSIWRHHTHG